MGRLDHLKQSLGKNATLKNCSLVVVDYSCPDRCGDWVEQHYLQCTVVRVAGEKHFNLSRARNMGFASTSSEDGEWVCFVDADVWLTEEFVKKVSDLMEKRCFLCVAKVPENKHLGGLLVVSRSDFVQVGGYDEDMEGYGRNAAYMRLALHHMGLQFKLLPAGLAHHIEHGEGDRIKHYAEKRKRKSFIENRKKLEKKMKQWHKSSGWIPPLEIYPKGFDFNPLSRVFRKTLEGVKKKFGNFLG